MSYPNLGVITRPFVPALCCLSSRGVESENKSVFIHVGVHTCIQDSIFNCVSHFAVQK